MKFKFLNGLYYVLHIIFVITIYKLGEHITDIYITETGTTELEMVRYVEYHTPVIPLFISGLKS